MARNADAKTQAEALDGTPYIALFRETGRAGDFAEGGEKERAARAGTLARDLGAAYSGPAIDVAVGFYELFQNHFFNSCLYVTLGGKEPVIRHVHRKVFLPTYGVFDEERFVDRGQDGVRAFDTVWGRVAILICEDAWHSLAATIAALDGAQVILVPSASPARGSDTDEEGAKLPASMVRWERVVQGIAEEHGVFVVLANLVGFEGGKGFPGASAVFDPTGELVVRGPLFAEALVEAELDVDLITHARADSPLLSDLQNAVPILIKGLEKGERGKGRGTAVKFDPAVNGSRARAPDSRAPTPHSPSVHVIRRAAGDEDPLRIDVALAEKWLVAFLKDQVVTRRA